PAATAWIAALTGTSRPSGRMALSNTMPRRESPLAEPEALPRGFASVTWPTSFVPRRMLKSPLPFASCASVAVTSSPAFAWRESTGFDNVAFISLPSATLAEPWLDDADAAALLSCEALALSRLADTDVFD